MLSFKSIFHIFKNFFQYFFKAGLVGMNSLTFYLLSKVFTLLSFLKDNFAHKNIVGWHFFSFDIPILSWPSEYLLKNPLETFFGGRGMRSSLYIFFLLLLLKFYLHL